MPKKIRLDECTGKDDQWVRPTHKFYFEINEKIREKKNLVSDMIRRAYTFNKSLTLDAIMAHLKKKGDPNSLYRFMEEFMKSPPEKLHENTIKKYRSTLNHLREFKKELFFSEIDSSFVQDFVKFLQVNQNLGGAACKKYMEAFKRVVRQARKENLFDPSQMEFLFDIKIKVAKAKRTFLDIVELKKWRSVVFPADKAYLVRDRDIFLFQIYTGYYHKDLLHFTKNQLSEDEEYGYMIVGERDKNGNQTIIPIFKFPYAATIIQRCKSAAPDKTVFDLKHFIEEPAYNRNLKEIAQLAGITKSVSNKVARHSNAQL